MNNTAVLWIRVSSEPQSHGYSLEAQEDLLKKAAEKLDVVETFRITESAKTSEKRRQFKAMVEYVKANKVGYIFAWNAKRLGRHYKDFTTLQSLIGSRKDIDKRFLMLETVRTSITDRPSSNRINSLSDERK